MKILKAMYLGTLLWSALVQFFCAIKAEKNGDVGFEFFHFLVALLLLMLYEVVRSFQ